MGTRWVRGNPGDEPDPLAVEACLRGDLPAPRLLPAERRTVVATLAARGMTDAEIAHTTRWGTGTRARWAVSSFRQRHHIPPGVPRVRQERADWWRDPETRERQVRRYAGDGWPDPLIARVAGVSASTVRSYRKAKGIPAGLPPGGWRPRRVRP